MNGVIKKVDTYNSRKDEKGVIMFAETIAGKTFLEMLQHYLLLVQN